MNRFQGKLQKVVNISHQNRSLIESGDLSIKSWITPTKIGDASNNKQHYRMDVSAKHTM
jgi:hypothetical protein